MSAACSSPCMVSSKLLVPGTSVLPLTLLLWDLWLLFQIHRCLYFGLVMPLLICCSVDDIVLTASSPDLLCDYSAASQ
uniref:Uncharacterized protein n=1 Tax=Arundo donax TaxID=35708 RepID=A0A0A8XZH9_ARUDO